MNQEIQPQQQPNVYELIMRTPINKIVDLQQVRDKAITNFMLAGNGDANMAVNKWSRNMLWVKQAIGKITVKVDPFSVYACLMMIQAYDYSAAPDDEEIYLVPFQGVLTIIRQAGAHVKRLVKTKQIESVLRSSLVYQGDVFEVKNKIVINHEEKYASNKIIAGYVVFLLANGKEKHVTFRPSDWESWRQKSPQKDGANWCYKSKDADGSDITQPGPGFLLNKILAHACKDKGQGWVPGTGLDHVEVYQEVINDDAGDGMEYQPKQMAASEIPEHFTETEEVKSEPKPAMKQTPIQQTITNDEF